MRAVRGRMSDGGSRVERRGQRQGLSFLADGFARGLYGLRFLRERLSRQLHYGVQAEVYGALTT